ncbi:hypothetical protein [Variovorax ginsengisoli]|uniref:DUF883 domain-containing protein n=1 Tax=Variovorax ginsengisoli TaxID=363844 RepID=A0ABT8SF60_9BURK|nr:hypothetical protein [Variovorax ginsengisoli]MDN8618220.1 hypothetical protein [Variovorax ginsengisoli]MDO1537390.1 hypothetical protein [Variovorax ginsengisoli]
MSDEATFSETPSTTSGITASASPMVAGFKPSAAEAGQAVKEAVSDVAGQTRQSVAKAAEQVQRAGVQAVNATKAYAHDAVDAAGRKLQAVKTQFETTKSSAAEYIHENPVRAVKMAAIGGAVLSAALVLFTRRAR